MNVKLYVKRIFEVLFERVSGHKFMTSPIFMKGNNIADLLDPHSTSFEVLTLSAPNHNHHLGKVRYVITLAENKFSYTLRYVYLVGSLFLWSHNRLLNGLYCLEKECRDSETESEKP